MTRAALAALLLLVVTCDRRGDTDRPAPFGVHRWETRAGKYAGKPVDIKVNMALDSVAGKPPFRHQIAVSVALREPQQDGLPSQAEWDTLGMVEEQIVATFVEPRLALHAMRVATDSRCDFFLYAADKQAAAKAAATLVERLAGKGVTCDIKRDQDWVTYNWYKMWQ